jgi:protein involved in polysaccharide export with SLBB domain
MMKATWLLIICCLLFSSLSAEVPPEGEPYRLQSGDRLYILIYTQPSSKRSVLVDPSGNINYLFAKNIPARGRTIASIKEELTHLMSSYFRDPLLLVSLVESTGDYYAIMGEVREPGYKRIVGAPTLLSAICEAKGFTTRYFREQTVDQSDLEKSFMVRNGEYLPIDFVGLVEEGDISQDVLLKSGDYIYISPTELRKVFVLGEVNSPTVVEFLESMTLSQAITEGGGLTSSASSRVAVIRGSLSLPIRFLVDINRIIKGKAIDFSLEPGDIIYVPPMKFAVLKEIVKMGIANFVSIVASSAGAAAYVSIQPAAAGVATQAIIDSNVSNFPVVTTP